MRSAGRGWFLGVVTASACGVVVAGACGGATEGDSAGQSGLPASMPTEDLSAAQLGRLCGWVESLGGVCAEDVVIESDESVAAAAVLQVLASCEEIFEACAITVGAFEACAKRMCDDPEQGALADSCSGVVRCVADSNQTTTEVEPVPGGLDAGANSSVDGSTPVNPLPVDAGAADGGAVDGGLVDADVRDGDVTEPPGYPDPLEPYGEPCSDDCPGECYVPGTGVNPICSRRCDLAEGCGPGALCQVSGSDTEAWCFRLCESDADCDEVNPHPGNPLYCAESTFRADPYYGDGDDPAANFCIQSSEP